MPFFESGSIKYYRCASLEHKGLYHAFFTRHGGLSPVPWHSLNFGASVGDEIQRVIRNREIALGCINLEPESVYDVYQIHSMEVVCTDRPLTVSETHLKADAIITNYTGVTLLMRFADCVPILLFDPVKRAIAIVHSGWIGTVGKILQKTVLALIENYKSNPSDLIAAIGPSIGPDHYSVGWDVIKQVYTSFNSKADQVIRKENECYFFDLWKANQLILSDMGVTKIELVGICTSCNLNDWYSHRGENGTTGRFGVVIGLR
jgi:hypothetical protein